MLEEFDNNKILDESFPENENLLLNLNNPL